LVVLHDGSSWFISGFDDLQGWEPLNAHLTTERLISVIVAVDGGDLSITGQVLRSFLVGWFKILTMTTPWCVELDNLTRRWSAYYTQLSALETYRGMIGLSDQRVIRLRSHLEDWRILCIEVRID
jgi:hypothetical protein